MAVTVSVPVLFCVFAFYGTQGFLLDKIGDVISTLFNNIPHKVCYGELGCFSNGSPFLSLHRPLSTSPQSPKQINTRFLLYTRANPTKEQLLKENDTSTIVYSNYNGSRPTKIIVHGFTDKANSSWVQSMVHELLINDDFNVIAVNWHDGAGMPYEQATANTRVVGAQIALLINELMNKTGQTADMFHIIGHSLGAQTAGYAGERIKGLGQITGLDPASPFFESTDTAVRLDPSDAMFVDVIHTDGGGVTNIGLGVTEPTGHVDFYPNGGEKQPGCSTDAVDKIGHTTWTAVTQLDFLASEQHLSCSHERAYQYYTESINHRTCAFVAYPCTSIDEFNRGHCLTCSGSGCSFMGFHSKESNARGSMYLNTESNSTYCGHTYIINMTASNSFDGILSATLTGTTGTTKPIQLMSTDEQHTGHSIISKMFMTREDIGNVTSVTLHYDKIDFQYVSGLYPDDWQLLGIALWNGDTHTRQTFCAYHKELHNHNSTTFKVKGTC